MFWLLSPDRVVLWHDLQTIPLTSLSERPAQLWDLMDQCVPFQIMPAQLDSKQAAEASKGWPVETAPTSASRKRVWILLYSISHNQSIIFHHFITGRCVETLEVGRNDLGRRVWKLPGYIGFTADQSTACLVSLTVSASDVFCKESQWQKVLFTRRLHARTKSVSFDSTATFKWTSEYTIQDSFEYHRKACVLLQPGDVVPAQSRLYGVSNINSQATVVAIVTLREG